MTMSFLIVFLLFTWVAIRRAYHKTLQLASGREGRLAVEGTAGANGGEGFTGDKLPYLHHHEKTMGSFSLLAPQPGAGATAVAVATAAPQEVVVATNVSALYAHAQPAGETKGAADKAPHPHGSEEEAEANAMQADLASDEASKLLVLSALKWRSHGADTSIEHTNALIRAATAAAAAESAATAAKELTKRRIEETNDMRKIFFDPKTGRFLWGFKLCWHGTWAGLNPQRKIDLIATVAFSIVYFAATLAAFLGPLPKDVPSPPPQRN